MEVSARPFSVATTWCHSWGAGGEVVVGSGLPLAGKAVRQGRLMWSLASEACPLVFGAQMSFSAWVCLSLSVLKKKKKEENDGVESNGLFQLHEAIIPASTNLAKGKAFAIHPARP